MQSKKKVVTSIDVGTIHIGICVMETDDDGYNPVISHMELITPVEIKQNTTSKNQKSINKKKKKKRVKPIDLKEIAYKLHEKLGPIIYHNVSDVIVEKQFTPGGGQNNRANTMSYMIFQYFVDESIYRNLPKNIVFVQPSCRFKLKTLPKNVDEIDKSRLKLKKHRKVYSVELTRQFLSDGDEQEWLNYMDTLKKSGTTNQDKQDDVSDAYLQCRNYIERSQK